MKKLKYMLLSLALIAVVGGALAFKAKFSTTYCTAPVNTDGSCPAACPAFTANSTIANAITSFCTTVPPNAQCTYLDVDQNPQPITCDRTTLLTTEQ
jgi:hypothetical protein